MQEDTVYLNDFRWASRPLNGVLGKMAKLPYNVEAGVKKV